MRLPLPQRRWLIETRPAPELVPNCGWEAVSGPYLREATAHDIARRMRWFAGSCFSEVRLRDTRTGKVVQPRFK